MYFFFPDINVWAWTKLNIFLFQKPLKKHYSKNFEIIWKRSLKLPNSYWQLYIQSHLSLYIPKTTQLKDLNLNKNFLISKNCNADGRTDWCRTVIGIT